MIEFKSKAEFAQFFGVPEDALVEVTAGETLTYAARTPLPEVTWRKIEVPQPEPGVVHEAVRFAVYTGLEGACTPEDQTGIMEDVIDALIANLPGDCSEMEDWLRAVKAGHA